MALLPVMPRTLRNLILPEGVFDDSLFDPQCKQRLLASIFTNLKADKALRDSDRWSGNPVVVPTSSKYSGPAGARLRLAMINFIICNL